MIMEGLILNPPVAPLKMHNWLANLESMKINKNKMNANKALNRTGGGASVSLQPTPAG